MNLTGSFAAQWFRLWIVTYGDWRPMCWNDSPPRATALEAVEDGLYTAAEAALFLEGFNGSMLQISRPIWAVAVPITVRYEGDAQPGEIVQGYRFPAEDACGDLVERSVTATSADREGAEQARGSAVDRSPGDHFQGFDQSPQRSR